MKKAAKKKQMSKVEMMAIFKAAAKKQSDFAFMSAVMGAEENAVATLMDAGRRAEYVDYLPAELKEELAEWTYGSLCCTSEFDQHEYVRDFFEALGYLW